MTNDNTKEGLLTKTLVAFFNEPRNLDIMIPILTESSPVSLRILDWFITNYSRDHIKILVKDPLFKEFNVYSSYKGQLKAYNKKLFDPFCRLHVNSRVKKFEFAYGGGKTITTTIGQLNFFKWAIENHIIEYVVAHHEEIKADLRKRETKKRSMSSSTLTSSSAAMSESSPCPASATSSEDVLSPEQQQASTPRRAYVIKFD